ncbi:MAG: hypothetical protein KAI47_10120, partial [Deltaproteobacteria bacterium]|nr:hypothetical protein [Deltaproteobacteria bacterium]
MSQVVARIGIVAACVAALASEAQGARFELVPTVGLADEPTCVGISHRDPKFVMIGTSKGRIHRT